MTEKEKTLEWFSNLPLEEQQTKMYHCCQGQDKGAFEFTEEDIENLYKLQQTNTK